MYVTVAFQCVEPRAEGRGGRGETDIKWEQVKGADLTGVA